MTDETPVSEDASEQPKATSASGEEAPKKRRGRRPKAEAAPTDEVSQQNEGAPAADVPAPVKPKRTYTRRKPKVENTETQGESTTPVADAAPTAESTPRPRRRSKAEKTDAEQETVSFDEMTRRTQEATHASSEVMPMPAATISEALAPSTARSGNTAAGDVQLAALQSGEQKAQDQQGQDQQGATQQQAQDQQGQDQQGATQQEAGQQGQQGSGRRRRHSSKGNGFGGNGGNGNGGNAGSGANAASSAHRQNGNGGTFSNNGNNNRRRNRRGAGQQEASGPSLTRDELLEMKVADLRSKAADLGVEYVGVRKSELVESIYLAAARAEGFRAVDGILEIGNEGYGWIRTGNYMEGDNDAFVHQSIIRQYSLRPGDRIEGTVGPGRNNSKYPPLQNVQSVNGRAPETMGSRPRFRDLTPIYPNEPLIMENGKDSITGRAIDLVAPIGKGQRGLIVSPPKAGKTTVLKKICQSIAANNPEVHLFCLLVDERPEEVTDMERSIRGTVVASTFDMPAENHTHVSELVIEHAKRLVEQGDDVVVVLDSITRLARAYNLAQPASGRILSGGVDSAALYPPKKFLGAARNIENGGSLTIIASALVDTGSKMDEVIFEEFKGTGNMELKLDRDLADKRIFPAIDPVASGTRNEDLLISPEIQPFVWGIRRILANMNNTERAATALVKGLKATNSNEEFLIRSAKKAQQSDYLGA